MIFVIAPNIKQANYHADNLRLSQYMWRFVRDGKDLLGTENPNVIWVGEWYLRDDVSYLEELIKLRWRQS